MKLIIDIPEDMHEQIKDGYVPLGISKYLKNGIPLDDVKAEIETLREGEQQIYGKESWNFVGKCLEIIDEHIGKAESEDKE